MDLIERRILGFTGASHFFTHFSMLLFPPLATTIAREFGMELESVFSMSFGMYLLYGIGAVPWGYVADWWSPRYAMASGIGMAGIALLVASRLANISHLPFVLAIVGFGNAAYHPTGLALISKGLSERGRGMGINGVMGSLGIALAPFGAGILGWRIGWRGTFTVFGIVGMVIAMAIVIVPFSVSRSTEKQQVSGTTGVHALQLFLLLCLGVVFTGLGYRTYTLALPSWIEQKMAQQFSVVGELFSSSNFAGNMEPDAFMAAVVTSIVMFMSIGGQLMGGWLADRLDLKIGYVLFFALAMLPVIAGIVFPGWAAVFFIGLFAFFVQGVQPIENSLYSILIPPQWRSSGFGVKFMLSFGIGALAVKIVSSVRPSIGLNGIMVLMSGYIAVTTLTSLVLLIAGRKTSLKHLSCP